MKKKPSARLMKYIPSTRPMIRNIVTCRRPWASGWRAVPAMGALPASPSPMAAPIAPPPSASPAASSPPRTASAWGRVLMWSLSSIRCLGCSPVMLLETFTGHAEINDGQQHEDECLDGADDEDVKDLPGHEQNDPDR